MENPQIGDRVLHDTEGLAEVIGIGSVATRSGPAAIYNLKFLEGAPAASVNCLREEFTFPVPDKTFR